MTIGVDARFFGPKGKGLGRYTQKLIESLEKADNQNRFLIFLRKENWHLYQPSSSRFQKILADYPWYSFSEQIFMPFKIWRAGIELMHFPHFNVPIFYFGHFFVTIHDLILRHFPTQRASTRSRPVYWFKNLCYRLVIWLAAKRAKKIIAVSDYVKSDIASSFHVPFDKIVVTYEGAPNINQKLETRNSKQIEDKYNIKNPYLLYVGNAYPHKNLEKLTEAFKILIEKYQKDLQLVLVGEEDYFYRRLKKYADDVMPENKIIFDRILFTGFVSDEELDDLYQNASLYVFPSLCEGFGLPPLEAMACGLPVVCSQATCLPEILGEAAVYFDAANPQDMAEKINQVLANYALRQKLISAGFAQIKKYSWEKMAKDTLEIYGNN